MRRFSVARPFFVKKWREESSLEKTSKKSLSAPRPVSWARERQLVLGTS